MKISVLFFCVHILNTVSYVVCTTQELSKHNTNPIHIVRIWTPEPVAYVVCRRCLGQSDHVYCRGWFGWKSCFALQFLPCTYSRVTYTELTCWDKPSQVGMEISDVILQSTLMRMCAYFILVIPTGFSEVVLILGLCHSSSFSCNTLTIDMAITQQDYHKIWVRITRTL